MRNAPAALFPGTPSFLGRQTVLPRRFALRRARSNDDARPKFPRTRLLVTGAALLALAGCSVTEWSTETKLEESSWQALHVVDTVQTMEIARNPACYNEVELGPIIGYHPSTGSVAAWSASEIVLHAGVTALMENYDAPRWVRRGWQSIWLGSAANGVAVNFRAGLGVGSVNPSKGYQANDWQCRATYSGASTSATTGPASIPMPPRGPGSPR